jgi:hypothetical protein
LLEEVRNGGHAAVRIDGDGDIADVCRLTSLELGMRVVDGDLQEGDQRQIPVLRIDGTHLEMRSPGAS